MRIGFALCLFGAILFLGVSCNTSPAELEPAAKAPDRAPIHLVRCGYQTAQGMRYVAMSRRAFQETWIAAAQEWLGPFQRGNVVDREFDELVGRRSYEFEILADHELPSKTGEMLPSKATIAVTIVERDDGTFESRALFGGVRDPLPPPPAELVQWLRAQSYEALERDTSRQISTLPWQPAALVFFDDLRTMRQDSAHSVLSHALLTLTRSRGADEAVPELLDRLSRLDRKDVEKLQNQNGQPGFSTRVLAMAVRARDGERDALRELLVLALEFHSRVELFDRALRNLFPADKNPELHARFPRGTRTSQLAFLQEVRNQFEKATHADGAWTANP
ncbi:MAG: hypothetical protein AAF517_22100 [Planctomycetota bacterium]